METFYDIYKDHAQHPGWRGVSELATSRLPYALHAPAIVTHFPFFRASREDANFERHKSHFSSYLEENRSHAFSAERLKDKDVKTNRHLAQPGLTSSLLADAANEIWRVCLEGLLEVEKWHSELFVFNAVILINLELNRHVHSTIVQRQITRTPPWDNDGLRRCAQPLTRDVLNKFMQRVEILLDKFVAAHNAPRNVYKPDPAGQAGAPDGAPTVAMVQRGFEDLELHPKEPTEGLGGFITWLENASVFNVPGVNQYDRKFLAFSNPKRVGDTHEPILDCYFLWRRVDRNWRYTDFEGVAHYPDPKNEDSAQCDEDLANFVQTLFASRALRNSFPRFEELEIFKKNPNAIKYPLPGMRTSGAQYFVIPAELLLLLVSHLDHFATKYPPPSNVRPPPLAEALKDARDALLALDSHAFPKSTEPDPTATGTRKAPQTLDELLQSSSPENLLSCGSVIRRRLDDLRDVLAQDASPTDGRATKRLDTFYESFATLAEVLWRTIYATDEFKPGYDDFVASTVIDGRAIYFSNFRSYEEIGFTRTFFVDFNLAPYQRGRLLRRLCEIATYRMSCVLDFNRFQALQEGISTLNNEFNRLAVARHEAPAERSSSITNALNGSSKLYQKALQMNIFITEGVTGRKKAVEADWAHVKRQVSDIREDRLGRYARLSDFLERGLALSVIEAGLIADRYENLLLRIRDHMATLRTEFDAFHAQNIEKGALDIQRVLSQSLKVSGHTEQLTTDLITVNADLKTNAIEHTRLLTGADLLVFIGGTYYLDGLLSKIVALVPGLSDQGLMNIAVTIGTLGFSFLTVAVVHARATGRPVWHSFRRRPIRSSGMAAADIGTAEAIS